MLDDGIATDTSWEQWALEARVLNLYRHADALLLEESDDVLELHRDTHARFLHRGLGSLNSGFLGLDASRTWICYWILHGLSLLDRPLPSQPARAAIIAFLASCQDPSGGFGGGPHQLPHLAPTYAAIAALVTLGGPEALSVVNRQGLLDFVHRMCVAPEAGGGMVMHEGGEIDVRGCYCALAACQMMGVDTGGVARACGMVDFIRRCQSYEGGLGGEPGNEAHGGYTYCGLAALCMLGSAHVLDIPTLVAWVTSLQAPFEGGFAGRTNKLVDGCYSFWQGAILPLLEREGLLDGSKGQWEEECIEGSQNSEGHRPHVAAALALVASLRRRLEAVELEQEQAEVAYQAAVADKGSDDDATAALQKAARLALARSQDLRESLDRARSHASAMACGADAMVAGGLPGDELYEAGGPGDTLPEPSLGQQASGEALQLWLLACCQELRGGMRDKPGKSPDYYHTCYCLSGLAVSQAWSSTVLGGQRNVLQAPDLTCNVGVKALAAARVWASGQPPLGHVEGR